MANVNGPRELPPPPETREPDPLRWIGLGLLALALLSYPWVSPFPAGRAWLGIPGILWYLFGVMVGLTVFAARQRPEA